MLVRVWRRDGSTCRSGVALVTCSSPAGGGRAGERVEFSRASISIDSTHRSHDKKGGSSLTLGTDASCQQHRMMERVLRRGIGRARSRTHVRRGFSLRRPSSPKAAPISHTVGGTGTGVLTRANGEKLVTVSVTVLACTSRICSGVSHAPLMKCTIDSKASSADRKYKSLPPRRPQSSRSRARMNIQGKSTSKAAPSAIRRAPQLGQKPRRLQLKTTSRSAWQSVQRTRKKRCSKRPHFR